MKMTKTYRIFLCLAAILAVNSVAFGQIAYSITDNNRDATGLEQQYYQFNLATGEGTLLGSLKIGEDIIRREYEGLASIGSVLYGVSEFDTETCNTGSDPITGLSSDLRIFRTPSEFPLPNGIDNYVGPQIGETCMPSGFTESAAAYNPVDGWIYAIAADDTLPASAPRSRLYRVSPTTGLATQVGSGATADGLIKTATCTGAPSTTCSAGGDENPYFDGLAILPDGRIFATEARFNNAEGAHGGLYRLYASGPQAGRAQFISNLLPADANRDTGLANNGTILWFLLEDGRVYTITNLVPHALGEAATARAVPVDYDPATPGDQNTLTTPGCFRPISFPGQFCGDFEGFDIPTVPVR